MDSSHPDFGILSQIRSAILARSGGTEGLEKNFPELVREALDFVIDPVRTARTRLSDLDNVEKTFVGLKVEHFFRDLLDVPKGIRDLEINGFDVDIKNTVRSTWMIPPETYRTEDPCVLIATAEEEGICRLGLMLARGTYLTAPNRDSKRSVSSAGKANIMWLVREIPFPKSHFHSVDMARFRELRRIKVGNERAAQFFRENLSKVFHRSVLQALLYDQLDYMKRLRKNGGCPDILTLERIEVLGGAYSDTRATALTAGVTLNVDEWTAIWR